MQDSQKNFHKKLLGSVGEKKARKFLESKGLKILKTNYKTNIGEIDIVAKEGSVVVFVEVKTRTSDDFGFPSEAVDYRKRRKYFLVAQQFLYEFRLTDSECRFDVMEIENNQISHIIDAFCM